MAPGIGPMFWMSVAGSDGLQREFQVTCYTSAARKSLLKSQHEAPYLKIEKSANATISRNG